MPPTPFPACVTDALTLAGLASLRRDAPTQWHRVMRRWARAPDEDATVEDALRGGGLGLLLPKGPTDRDAWALKRLRHCARRLVAAYGAVRLRDIDERWLMGIRRGACDALQVGPEVAGRCLTLLRQLTHRFQQGLDGARVVRRLRPRRRAPLGQTERPGPAPWDTFEHLVARAALRVRAGVALQGHVGARTRRVLALRVDQVDLDAGLVTMRIPGRGGPVEMVYALPRDAIRAIRPWLRHRARAGPRALLFPKRGQPGRPTASLNRAIAREARKLGLEPTTMAAIRRWGQVGLRGVGAVRAQVRGSARRPARNLRLSDAELDRQRAGWAFEMGTAPQQAPARAPRRCRADQPERRPRQIWRRGRLQPVVPATPLDRRSPWGGGPSPTREVDRDVQQILDESVRRAGWPSLGGTPPVAPAGRGGPAGARTATVHGSGGRRLVPVPMTDEVTGALLLGLAGGGVAGILARDTVEGVLEGVVEMVRRVGAP